jgi:hypothetical protein
MIPPGCRPRCSLSKRQYNFCVNAAPHHRRRQIAPPIWWASWLRMAGHLLSKGLLHGIRSNRRVSSLRRCRELRCRHSRGLRHRPIDRLGSLSLAATHISGSRRRAGAQGPFPGEPGLARPSVDHQHGRLHGAGAEPVQGFLAGLINAAGVAHRMHDLRCPVGSTRHPSGIGPGSRCRLELGPLGRCPSLLAAMTL